MYISWVISIILTLLFSEIVKSIVYIGIKLLSGSLDESPSAYKDIHEVVAAQSDLIKVLARFEPKIVKMAHSEKFRKKKDKGAE